MKTVRRVSATLLATVALAACSDSSDEQANAVPYQWISSQYARVPVGHVDKKDRPGSVADEISGHTSARDRGRDGNTVYLRYREDIVSIAPYKRGSRIEVVDYRTGYQRWYGKLPSKWPHPDSNEFRGGGPGAGK
ncbi:DUF4247 domain-containing protein [Streptomyces uncialis]|uniref:DUF4247 domain-containing protein n=1 Tax=Streptomyces uncialis TaxID=1048205 RepID=UPI00386C7C50|nr:DUF4247 domain-containing protein [Streptomyces uncialis]